MGDAAKHIDHAVPQTAGRRSHAIKVLSAGMVGHFVEFYDFAVYGLSVLTIAKHFFPQSDPFSSVLSAFAVYGLAFVARPLGGIIFGAIGDRVGRKDAGNHTDRHRCGDDADRAYANLRADWYRSADNAADMSIGSRILGRRRGGRGTSIRARTRSGRTARPMGVQCHRDVRISRNRGRTPSRSDFQRDVC